MNIVPKIPQANLPPNLPRKRGKQARIYQVQEGSITQGTKLQLEPIYTCTVSGASQYLHSKEFIKKFIIDRGLTQAEFVVIADHQHYFIAPITIYACKDLATLTNPGKL